MCIRDSSNEALFRRVLAATGGTVRSVLELGANVGNNLVALRALRPELALHAVEINPVAAARITAWGGAGVDIASLLDWTCPAAAYDLVFTKGVLIHINPDELTRVYDLMVHASARWVMVCEYYNPTPVEVSYRGHEHAPVSYTHLDVYKRQDLYARHGRAGARAARRHPVRRPAAHGDDRLRPGRRCPGRPPGDDDSRQPRAALGLSLIHI